MELSFPHPARTVLATAATVVLALSSAGCTPAPKVSSDPDVFSVAASAAVTTWDPVRSFSTEALYMGNIYEPLLWKNPEGSAEEFKPAIAESWSSSEDGKAWTFKIRSGATFHDGEPVDAAAVKASIDAARERAAASFIWAPVESVETPDDTTVAINLKYAAPMDLVASSTYGAWIVSPKALAASAKDEKYFDAGIDAGSGPYTVDSYKPGSEIVLKKFEAYWNKEASPHFDVVDISITPDAVTAQQMLTAGEVDYATSIPLENVKTLADDPKFTVKDFNSPFNFLAMFNTSRAPLNDPEVRRALSYAIPYKEIIDIGGQGYGTQSHGPAPSGIFPYSQDVPQYSQDLDKAKQLLAAAGHPDGLKLKLTYASENPAEARFVPLIKDAFAKIGVEVDVKAELFNQQWDAAKADPTTAQDIFVLHYWPTYSDAGSDNLTSLFRSSEKPSFNLSYWKSPEYDKLVDKAATLTGTDRAAAQDLYKEAMDLLYREAPAAFLYDARAVSVVPVGLNVPQFNENYPFTVFFAPIKPAA
ncbi:ABC transporter substrate-binding protein [Pseudarthrobacter sp. NIBRBAC000502772]|nr:ABC transporter substrate-binding protein [Pseudarthrobacter sp. NIBRBAC000502772]